MTSIDVAAQIVVGDYVLECVVSLLGSRLLDHLNDPMTDFLRVSRVAVRQTCGGPPLATVDEAVVQKAHVKMVILCGDHHECPERRINSYAAKQRQTAVLLVGAFELRGELHLKGNSDPTYMLLREFDRFFPLTGASVSFRSAPIELPQPSLVFVQKSHVGMIQSVRRTASIGLSELLAELVRE
jgi:hypothetical protein